MGSLGVVLDPPLSQGLEPVLIQTFLLEVPIERLDVGIIRGLANMTLFR